MSPAPRPKRENEVVVGNLGTVHASTSRIEALNTFNRYAELSVKGYGRVAHEPVTLMRDGDIYKEIGS